MEKRRFVLTVTLVLAAAFIASNLQSNDAPSGMAGTFIQSPSNVKDGQYIGGSYRALQSSTPAIQRSMGLQTFSCVTIGGDCTCPYLNDVQNNCDQQQNVCSQGTCVYPLNQILQPTPTTRLEMCVFDEKQRSCVCPDTNIDPLMDPCRQADARSCFETYCEVPL